MNNRKAMLAKIHIAKKQLGLDDESYREILKTLTGQESSANLNDTKLEKVLAHMKSKGATFVRRKSNIGYHRKIQALWYNLYDFGAVKSKSMNALNAYIKRMTQIEKLEWLDAQQSIRVIEALKQWGYRVFRKAPNNQHIEK